MQRSRWPLILAAVTFVLALFSGIYTYTILLQTVPILIAVGDLPAGTLLRSDMVKVRYIPAGGRPTGALIGPGQAVGHFAALPILAHQVLTDRQLSDQPPARDPLTGIVESQRVVSVPVRAEAALGGALAPGDRVDVAAAWPGENRPGPVEVLASGVTVVDLRNRAGESTLVPGGPPTDPVPVTALLLVSSPQAHNLTAAAESNATLYLWLMGRDPR